MRFKFALLALALTACHQSRPEPIIQTVYCVTPEQYKKLVDAEPGKVGNTLTGNAQKDFKIVAGQDVLLRQYADGLLSVIGGCIGQPQQPAS